MTPLGFSIFIEAVLKILSLYSGICYLNLVSTNTYLSSL